MAQAELAPLSGRLRVQAPDHPRITLWTRARRVLRQPLPLLSLVILGVGLAWAVWPVALLPHDPTFSDLLLRFKPPFWVQGAEPGYPLGTDNLGRDILSRVVNGARYSLLITVGAVVISAVIGLVTGLVAGFYRGRTDDIIMRLADITLAFPAIILIIAIVGIFGPNLLNLVLILGVSGWARYARLVRGSALSVREQDYILAARTIGANDTAIMGRHVLPNLMHGVIVLTTFELARLLLLESGLSFLGLGVQPPTPSWGGMIGDGRNYLYEGWWITALPGAAIVLTVLAFNFLGDALQDILDPRTRTR
jgi:ABC-type dipeptide/oligopeptide/nickel transport system permease subunit